MGGRRDAGPNISHRTKMPFSASQARAERAQALVHAPGPVPPLISSTWPFHIFNLHPERTLSKIKFSTNLDDKVNMVETPKIARSA